MEKLPHPPILEFVHFFLASLQAKTEAISKLVEDEENHENFIFKSKVIFWESCKNHFQTHIKNEIICNFIMKLIPWFFRFFWYCLKKKVWIFLDWSSVFLFLCQKSRKVFILKRISLLVCWRIIFWTEKKIMNHCISNENHSESKNFQFLYRFL